MGKGRGQEEQSLETVIGSLAGAVTLVFVFAAIFSYALDFDYLAAHPQYPIGVIVVVAGGYTIYRLRRVFRRHEHSADDSRRLYGAAQRLFKSINQLPPEAAESFFDEEISHYLPLPASPQLTAVAQRLYSQEDFSALPPPTGGPGEHSAYRDVLREQMRAFERPQETYDLFLQTIINALAVFRSTLPHHEDDALSVPAIDLVADAGEAVRELLANFYQPAVCERGLFAELRRITDQNVLRVTEKYLPASSRSTGRVLNPKEHPGTPREIVDDYLGDTPLRDMFYVPIPFGLPVTIRFEHTHIVAGSGHGKTQTLQHLIVSDLSQPDPPALVIIDSQGNMLQKLSRLALFDPHGGALASRLIIIDPTDIEHPPALNLFDINQDRLRTYGAAAREQIFNGIVDLYDYMFGSLLGAELTQKHGMIFRHLARLMLAIPGATIIDLLRLMDNAAPYLRQIEALPIGSRTFFQTDFMHRAFEPTKQQIRRRLLSILENPTFERMFAAPKNRVDMFDALNTGKIILVNTAKDFLTQERSSLLGRFFVSLTLQAALERAALAPHQRRPAFLYIDEAADYFDDNIDNLLNQARKYKLGVVFAHQYLDQLAPGLRASIAANTSTKLAGGVSEADARSLAGDMHTSADFILAQHKQADGTRLACAIRNVTAKALTLSIPFGRLEREPTMTEDAYEELIAINRGRTSSVTQEPSSPESSVASGVRVHSPDLAWNLEPQPNGNVPRVEANGDVHYELEIAWADLGSYQEIPLADRTIHVRIPGDVGSGEVLRLHARGKVVAPGKSPGDLYITVKLPDLMIGDLIQWEDDGVPQLDMPRRVRGAQTHQGQTWVFVEGSETGIPLTQVIRVDAADAIESLAKPSPVRRRIGARQREDRGDLPLPPPTVPSKRTA